MENGTEEPEQEERERTNCEICISGSKMVTTTAFTHVGLLSLVVCYCMAGAAIFEALEAGHEIVVKKNITNIRESVAYDLWNMTRGLTYIKPENWSAYASERLVQLEVELLDAIRNQGWDGEERTDIQNWNKLGALFYSIIVITTIGYGHIAPKTMWGKIVTIFYAVIGIPLMVICLSHIGDLLANSFRVIYWKVCCYVCTRNPRPHRGGRNRRSVRSRGAGSIRMKSLSIRRSVRTSQRSADSVPSVDSMNSMVSDPGVMNLNTPHYQNHRGHPIQRNQPQSSSLPRTTQPRGIPHPGLYVPRSSMSAEPELLPTPTALQNLPVLYNRYAEDLPYEEEEFQQAYDIKEEFQQAYDIKEEFQQAYDIEEEEEYDDPMPMPRFSRNVMKSTPPEPYYPAEEEELEYWDEDEEEEEDYDEYEEEENMERRPVPMWLCSFLVVGYIIGGAFLFHGWEGWTLLDSAYFCVITLTTIGFGDFVPQTANAEVSIALCSLYLLIGIALLAMSFNLVQEQVITAFKNLAIRLGILSEEEA